MGNTQLTESLYYIMLSVIKPNYGYGIMENISKITNNRITMGAGTLYGAINNLLERNYIELYSEEKFSRKKKEYVITELGIQVLKSEIIRLEELLNVGKEILNDKI